MTARTDGIDALTTDGAVVHLRAADAGDEPAVLDLYRRASADTLRMRFLHQPGPGTLRTDAARICHPAPDRYSAVATTTGGALVGVASFERQDGGTAEFSVFVDDGHHGRGIGTLLLEQLAVEAGRRGLVELEGDVLGGNHAMARLVGDLTVGARTRVESGVATVHVPIRGGLAEDPVDVREAYAEHRSLTPLLRPRSVAVVGAGRTSGVGHETLKALVEYGFPGPLSAVNPHAAQVAGRPAYPSLVAVPGGVDLAVVAVPAPAVPGVLADAVRAGVRAVVVLSAGFADAGAAGRARQAELVRLARGHGMRLVGPNCLGVLNTDPAFRLNASFAPGVPARGGLGVAAQSGAVAIALLEHARRDGTGVSTVVSLGDKADVSGNDLLAWWLDDTATTVVALYLESFGNPRRFGRLVRAVARRKPVLVLKSGRSAAGRRAGVSHTAAAAASDVVVDALFRQAGVTRVDTLDELIDAARLLAGRSLPAGDRLAVVGNAGGLNVLAADAAEAAGLRLPTAADTPNPLDLGAGASPAACAAAVTAAATGGAADALLVTLVGTRANDLPGLLRATGTALDAHPDLPAAVVAVGDVPPHHTVCGVRHVPVYPTAEAAVRALGHAARYAAWRRGPHGTPVHPAGTDAVAARRAVSPGGAPRTGWQPWTVTADLLGAYGIPVVAAELAATPPEAVAAADRLGYPAVFKAADPDLVHRTEAGAVRLGLAGPDAVRDAARELLAAHPGGVLVEATATGTVELAAGVVHDPRFGSLVMAGVGGVRADVLADRDFRLVPLTDLDARVTWRSLRAAALLDGYRGDPPVDVAALADLTARLGRLAEDFPEVAELDLNPVVAGPDGALVVDAKLRLTAVGDEPDGMLRALTG